jgi:hypothetical protein
LLLLGPISMSEIASWAGLRLLWAAPAGCGCNSIRPVLLLLRLRQHGRQAQRLEPEPAAPTFGVVQVLVA